MKKNIITTLIVLFNLIALSTEAKDINNSDVKNAICCGMISDDYDEDAKTGYMLMFNSNYKNITVIQGDGCKYTYKYIDYSYKALPLKDGDEIEVWLENPNGPDIYFLAIYSNTIKEKIFVGLKIGDQIVSFDADVVYFVEKHLYLHDPNFWIYDLDLKKSFGWLYVWLKSHIRK